MRKTFLLFSLSLSWALFSQNLWAQTLTVWTSSVPVKTAIQGLTADFERNHKVKIIVEVFDKNLTSLFKAEALRKKGPDILVWANDVVGELADSNLIEPLSIPENLKAAFVPLALQAFTYKGTVYGYPYDIEALALIYNKNMVKTPPTSMEELVKIAKKIADEKSERAGFLYDFSNFFFSFPFFSASSGSLFKEEKGKLNLQQLTLSSKNQIETANFLLSLAKLGIIPSSTTYKSTMDKMKEGKLAMTIDGAWALAELKQAKIPYGVAPLPTLGGKAPRPFVGSHGFIIRKASPHKKLAKLFIENALVTKQGIISLYKADPREPSRLDALKELALKDSELLEFMKSAQNGIPMPNVPEMGALWGVMNLALKSIVSSQEGPKEALERAENQVKAILIKK